MNTQLLLSLAISLVLTLVFETAFFLVTGILGTVKRNKKDLLLVIMVNVLTNPVVVLLYWLSALYTNWNRTLVKIPLEIFAVLTEWLYYRKYAQTIKKPFLFSLAANAFSFTAGLLLQLII